MANAGSASFTPVACPAVLFLYPSFRALIQAFQLNDPFGGSVQWVGFSNFTALFASAPYWASAKLTLWFTLSQNAITLSVALLFAFATNHIVRARGTYRAILLLPYAIAPAVAGIMLAFLFNTRVGPISQIMHMLGIGWDPTRNSMDAMILIVLAASRKHICYNYIFLVAALLAVPRSILESAAIDGAGPLRRFQRISLPMIAPTLFFWSSSILSMACSTPLRSSTRRHAVALPVQHRSLYTKFTGMASSIWIWGRQLPSLSFS